MRTVHLVSCCGEKLATPAPAREIYRSQLFRLASAYAERQGGAWLILSARHGVLDPDQVVDPYDQRLARSRADRRLWAALVAAQLNRRQEWQPARYVSLCGAPYTEHVEQLLPAGSVIEQPLQGLGIGQRLAWLTAACRAPVVFD